MKKEFDLLIATGLFPPDIGGPATYSKLLSEELLKRGIKVKVLSFGEVRSLPKVFRHIFYMVKVFLWGRKSKIIYAQDPVSVGLPVLVATLLLRRGYFLKIVGDYAWEQGSQRFNVKDLLDVFARKNKGYDWRVQILKNIQKIVVNKAKTIIVPSLYLKNIVSSWGVESEKINVIYNSFNKPTALLNKEELYHKLNLSGRNLISVGRLVPWKGFELLIKTMVILNREYSDLRLLIVGDGPEQKKLEDLTIKLGLKNVLFLGRLSREKLLEYITASEIFVLNTSYEGFSHQLLEVMWCRTPIITTNVGGNPELIESGNNGLLIEYNNELDLVNSIKSLLSDSQKSRILAENAYQRLEDFSRERMINSLINVLFN